MSRNDEIAYDFPEDEIAKLTCMRDVNEYVNRKRAYESDDARNEVIQALQERLFCSHWSV